MPQFANLTKGLRFRIVLGPGVAIGPGKADPLHAIDETASPKSARTSTTRWRATPAPTCSPAAPTERPATRSPTSRTPSEDATFAETYRRLADQGNSLGQYLLGAAYRAGYSSHGGCLCRPKHLLAERYPQQRVIYDRG